MKKILVIALALITLGAIVVIGTYVFQMTIPGNLVVVETPSGDYEVKAYQNAMCTIPLTYVDWGSMQRGESKDFTFYVKNTGDQNITNVFAEADYPQVSSGGGGYGPLAVGQSRQIVIPFLVYASASPGSYPVDLVISCTA